MQPYHGFWGSSAKQPINAQINEQKKQKNKAHPVAYKGSVQCKEGHFKNVVRYNNYLLKNAGLPEGQIFR